MMDVSVHSETDDPNGEGEGVWSPEIEQAFQEALKMFPPCGRRKHILQEEGGGKMYGRNELIARHIERRTGQRRTRKQVSSHIQVLSRREARTKANSHRGDSDSVSPASSITASSLGGTGHLSRPDSATSGYNNNNGNSNGNGNSNSNSNGIMAMDTGNFHNHHSLNHHHHHHHHHPYNFNANHLAAAAAANTLTAANPYDFWEDRPIMTRKIRLVEFSAFVEQRKLATSTTTAATTTNGNIGAAVLSQATQAAVLARIAAGSDPTVAAMAAATTNDLSGHNHLQVPPFADAYTSSNSVAHSHSLSTQFVNHSNPAAAHPSSAQINGHTALHHPCNQNNHSHNQMQNELLLTTSTNGNGNTNTASSQDLGQNQPHAPAGFHRHSFVKIDYRQLSERQSNKMERIDIREIQDKFPDIGGPDGLFQRSSQDNFFLVKFWADLDYDFEYGLFEDQNSYLGFSSHFETSAPFKDLTCSTKACSYGNQVVEKVEKIYGAFNSANNTYSYAINRSPMCEFMIQFIKKLRQLPELPLMNRILENFTVLQLVTSESTSEILMCIAYVFEIASLRQSTTTATGSGSHYHVYKLTKD